VVAADFDRFVTRADARQHWVCDATVVREITLCCELFEETGSGVRLFPDPLPAWGATGGVGQGDVLVRG
jgi:hypothetical protein